ncbi:class I SAM-dependent methyltransferase, partial [Flavobacteriales bacterium]|nr:class I SAM-dependent methyltransferase [Flavobacteriales bacterium]
MQTITENQLDTVTHFYEKLGINGLSNLLDKESDNHYVNYVQSNIVSGNILDAGCGYGRIAVPLYESGYSIEGVDIMPSFIKHVNAKTSSNKFIVCDLRKIPYENQSFDNIICMWSTFSHFLEQTDQIKVLQELYRVLKTNGKVIIDLPTPEIYSFPKLTAVKTEQTINRLCQYTVKGNENTDYVH